MWALGGGRKGSREAIGRPESVGLRAWMRVLDGCCVGRCEKAFCGRRGVRVCA